MSDLILPHDVNARIEAYVDAIDAEIGMFGYVTMTDEGDFLVDTVFLVEQTVSGSSVDFKDSGLEYAIARDIKDDRLEDLMFCCHSHVDMDAFWSATDEKMISGMNNGMTPFLVSLVVNKRRETKQRVDFFNPEGPIGTFCKQVKFPLDLVLLPNEDESIANEVKALVTESKSLYSAKSYGAWTTPPTTSHWTVPVTNAAGDVVGYEPDDYWDEELFGFTVEEMNDIMKGATK